MTPVRQPKIIVALTLAILLSATGCRGKHSRTAVQNDEPEPTAKPALASAFKVNDPGAPAQLTKGFYGLESNTWRWTSGNFSVLLKTPPGAAQTGATLTLALVISNDVLKAVESQTVTANIAGKPLKSEKYTTAGNHTFSANIPAASLAGDTVTIDFSVDKPLPPGPADRRELAIIATAIGLESK